MSQPTILLACPNCEHTFRTRRETRPGAGIRCSGCDGMFYFFIHGNGAVELRPADDEPVAEPANESRLPPRVAEEGEAQGTRKILASRRRNRPIGGYGPFEKSRSYIGGFAAWIVLGLGALAVYWYASNIDTIGRARGRTVNAVQNMDIEAKRKEHLERQKRALARLKKQPTAVQSSGGHAEDERPPGQTTHD
jgi:hypothetical protein